MGQGTHLKADISLQTCHAVERLSTQMQPTTTPHSAELYKLPARHIGNELDGHANNNIQVTVWHTHVLRTKRMHEITELTQPPTIPWHKS